MRAARRRRPAPGRHLPAVLLLSALLAACTVGPSARPPVAVRGEGPGPVAPAPTPTAPALPPPEPATASLGFTDCTGPLRRDLGPSPADRTLRLDCADLVVRRDPSATGSGVDRTGLRVVRAALADAPPDRPPLLVVGDSTAEPSARHAVDLADRVPLGLLQQYNLVGLDRRGSGADLLACAPAADVAALVDADPLAVTADGLAAVLAASRRLVQECTVTLPGSSLGTYRSATTVADVEALRAALGVGRLAALGTGDGADVLGAWAREHPAAVGRLVLDGPTDPALDEPDATRARAAATEASVDAYATWCTAGGACPLGPDPRATVRALLERLRDRPLVAADGRRLTAGAALTAVLDAVGEPRDREALTAALVAAGAGDPTPLLARLGPVTGPGGTFEARLATACNDGARRLAPGDVETLAGPWAAEYPLVGALLAQRLLACGPWPAGLARPPAAVPTGVPPILVIGTAAQPRATVEGSRAAADTLPDARFLTWQGSGIGAYPRTPCVADAVAAHLVEGVPPRDGLLCPP